MERISLCTQICDRNEFLQQTLPTWIKFPCDEIVILDWPNNETAEDVVKHFQDPRIRLFKVLDDENYNINIARNTMIRHATGNVIFCIDADTLIFENLKDQLELNKTKFIQGMLLSEGFAHRWLSGTCMFYKDQWSTVNGYNEKFKGWGYDEKDFYERLEIAGFERKYWPKGTLEHINHNDNLRVANYIIKDVNKSLELNMRMANLNTWSINNHQHPLRTSEVTGNKSS